MLFLVVALIVVLVTLLIVLALMRQRRGKLQAVLSRVEPDYLTALGWLQDTAFAPPNPTQARQYLCETALKRYCDVATQYDGNERFVGVLRTSHTLEVRPLSDNNLRCLLLDTQICRRMATYNRATAARVSTQALGDAVRVVVMAYDTDAGRWKIADDIQRLPVGWGEHRANSHYHTQVEPLTGVGRDS